MAAVSYTAQRIHDGVKWLPTGTTIVVGADGLVLEILPAPLTDTKVFAGVLCPGFVNAHCHLELSHLKGVAPEKTGIVDFLIFMSTRRQEFEQYDKAGAMTAALSEMKSNGIVAIGDIANGTDTLSVRAQSDIRFHTFVEALGMVPAGAEKRFDFYRELYQKFAAQIGRHKQSITPHAPYSVSERLFRLIDEFEPDSILSIHNQEGACENDLFRSGKGDLHQLFQALNIPEFHLESHQQNSLSTYVTWLTASHPVILVHNTFCEAEDLRVAKEHFSNLWFCLCPNANIYIEGRLPDVPLLLNENANICIGTDSLASNHQLSIISELQMLKENFKNLDWEMLLKWGTYNGAKALQLEQEFGRITIGKKPGLIQLSGLEEDKPVATRII